MLAALLSGLVLAACSSNDSAPELTIAIDASVIAGNTPLVVQFQAQVPPIEAADFRYEWAFGDGTSGTGESLRHTFEQEGTFTVRLTVSDGRGGSGQDSLDIVVGPSADLSVADVVVTPLRAKAGDEVVVNWSVRNLAAPVVGEWIQAVVVSADRNFDESDVVIGRRTQTDDVGPSVMAQQVPVTLPDDIESGDWFVAVVADYDGLVGDLDRSNNIFWSTGKLQIRNPSETGPDLVICGISIPAFDSLPTDVEPTAQLDDQIEVDVCLGNVGNRPVGAANFTVYVSSDETLDPNDANVGVSQSIALGSGDRAQVRLLIDISDPITAGSWFILAEADTGNMIDEQNETNNQRLWSDPIVVVEPGNVDGVDLVLKRFTSASERAYWGQTLPGTVVLANRGTQSVERFFVVRFLAEPTAGGAPIVVHSLNVDGIAAGAEESIDVGIPINRRLDEGEYRLSVVADPTNSTEDVNLANNQRSVSGTLVLGGDPSVDPAVGDVTFAPTSVAAGNAINIGASIRNLGRDSSGVIEYAIFLSADESYSVQDSQLMSGRIETLDGGGTEALDLMVTIPVDIDQQIEQWYVGVIVDPARRITGELSEDNNVGFALETLTVTGATGGCRDDDREPNDTRETASIIEAGSFAELGLCGNQDWFEVTVPPQHVLDVSVQWNETEGGLTLDLLSEDGTVLNTGEGVLGNRTAFIMPDADVRTVYVRLTSEGTRFQYDLAVALEDAQGGIDLRGTVLSVAPRLAQPGQAVAIQFDAVNVGTTGAEPSEATVYLNDVPGTQGGTFLGRIPVAIVPARTQIAVQGTLDIPAVGIDNGDYFLIVQLDGTETSQELNETNNLLVGRLRIDQDLACVPDEREPNGSAFEPGGAPQFAHALPAGEHRDLTVCSGDDDWYAVALDVGQRLAATCTYNQGEGDVELTLYGPDGVTIIDESSSILGQDSVELARSEQAGLYFLRVFLKPNADVQSNEYDLVLLVDNAALCQDDPFEPDNPDTIPLLPDGLHDLKLCGGDIDSYRFAIPAGNTVSWTLTAGDAPLTMTLVNPDGVEVASNERRIAHQAQQNGNYVLTVTAADEGEYPYQLRTSGVSGVDLAIDGIELSRVAVGPGADLRVRSVLSNRRGDNARNIQLRYVLSPDPDPSADDTVLRESLIPLIAGAEQLELSERIRLPADFGNLPGFEGAEFPLDAFVIGVIDPERTVPDVRLANNQASASVRLEPSCVDDDQRTNEGPATATDLMMSGEDVNNQVGVICAFTEDWYRLTVDSPGILDVRLSFLQGQGDLDLVAYDAATGALLAASRTEDSVELLRIMVDAGDIIHLQIDGFDEAENDYSLTWSLQ
ncbi:MAG: hypothetical protein CMH52_09670 [Myxococcales bacterium]|nr:hypothetical protein [Myxococcales bacterium]